MAQLPDNNNISYAQNNEDITLAAIFENIKTGFYVDIGANHPDLHSVTKYFYLRGWRGINIEPNPRLFKLLKKKRTRDINLNVGISDKAGALSLRVYHSGDELEGLSTFSSKVKSSYLQQNDNITKNYDDITVPVKTLASILNKYAKDTTINFLKIDVEGLEHKVIKGNDWKFFAPEIICIESNHVVHEWHGMLKTAGYNLAYNDGLNEYFATRESYEKYNLKDISERVVGRSMSVLKHHQFQKWLAMTKELGNLQSLIQEQNKKIIDLQDLSSLSLKNVQWTRRLKRSIYGLTIDWINYKRRK